MSDIISITNQSTLDELIQKSHNQPVLILKHSTTCSISAAANREFKDFAAKQEVRPDLLVGIILVREDRPVSNSLAELTEIQHQSPQAILLKNGKPIWHASHWDITDGLLEEAVLTWAN